MKIWFFLSGSQQSLLVPVLKWIKAVHLNKFTPKYELEWEDYSRGMIIIHNRVLYNKGFVMTKKYKHNIRNDSSYVASV